MFQFAKDRNSSVVTWGYKEFYEVAGFIVVGARV